MLTIVLAFTACFATCARAEFGLVPGTMSAAITNQDRTPDTRAGSHPFQVTVGVAFNRATNEAGSVIADGNVKDLVAGLPPGLVGNPTVVPQCSSVDFNTPSSTNLYNGASCPVDTQIGVATISLTSGVPRLALPVYNLVPPYGAPAEFGFNPIGLGIELAPSVRSGIDSDYGLNVKAEDVSQTVGILDSAVTIWGVPGDHGHDTLRGDCLESSPPQSIGSCPLSEPESPKAFLTMPAACNGPLDTRVAADSWQSPGRRLPDGEPDLSDPAWKTESVLSLNDEGNPTGLDGCNQLSFTSEASSRPTTDSASSPTGLDFNLDITDPGLTDVKGTAQSEIRKASVTLPQGMTINPSAGAGLSGCTPTELAAETLKSLPGEGCPNSSKIGEVTIVTPLLDTPVPGSLYVAQQNDNPFNSLLALYIVAKDPATGILVKLAGKVQPNEETGQLTTTFDNLPQLPFSHFNLHFREGQRSPLITPPACGTYQVKALLTPWSNPEAVREDASAFSVTHGVEGGPCPSGGVPPFNPQVSAGTLNNNAGAFSPFYVRMTRKDGEQEITHFSAQLPPGLTGTLAGVATCPDAAIAAAKLKSGSEEEEHPSCPAASEIGHTLVGAGVGSVLAYAPGRVYLSGPYHGSPISIAAITTAKVGPFDLGTVVVRSAFKIDPATAQVNVDSAGSDPIPHIIDGIPVHLRDIRVYVDRPEFTLNPTSCNPFAVVSTLMGSGADFASTADDSSAAVSDRFQAANCSSLGFKPKLALRLKGGTKRGGHPQLSAALTARPGDANISRAQVTLPHSEFLDQAHIKTVCTRVQFAANQCPAASVYGFARATTPLLDKPLEGPVYLRSSSNKLPDLVAALGGQITVDLDGRIDTGKGRGIRNTFEVVPDAPVSRFTLSMQGGKKGLLVNSENLCSSGAKTHATVDLTAQNGKVYDTTPAVGNSCRATPHRKHKSGGRG
jgi:hypothetical protein